MAVIKIRTASRNAMLAALIADLDLGSGPSILEFYTGTLVAPGGSLGAQVKLGTVTCSDPTATVDAGVATFGTITQDDMADNGGTAAWAMHKASDGTHINSYDVTDEAGNGIIKLNTVEIIAGGPIQVASFVITQGGA